MMSLLKAEFRKLFTIRTTYIFSGIILLIVAGASFFIEGVGTSGAPFDGHKIGSVIYSATPVIAIFGAIVCVLLMANEYRHNTIYYTLTYARSRSKVLFAKLVGVFSYTLFMMILSLTISIGLTYLGAKIKGFHIPTQETSLFVYAGRSFLLSLGMALFGLLFITLTRSLVVAIVLLLVTPSFIEPLLGLLLKSKAAYLPFNTLFGLIDSHAKFGLGKSCVVLAAYLVIGWATTWILFVKRDAN